MESDTSDASADQADSEPIDQADEASVATAEERFWASPYGQARKARMAGHRYFQMDMWIDNTYYVRTPGQTGGVASETRRNERLGEILTHVEAEGWELINAGFVFREAGQVSRDKWLSSGQQVTTTGSTVGIYLFRATDTPTRSDEVWLGWTGSTKTSPAE
jgi:hypothetical protein